MQKQSKEKTALGTQLKVGLKSIAKNYQLYLLLLPGLLWFLAFAYRPVCGSHSTIITFSAGLRAVNLWG